MKCIAFIVRTVVYKSGSTSVRFFLRFRANADIDIEVSGDEFVRYFDFVPLKYPDCHLDSPQGADIFSESFVRYGVKEKPEDFCE